MSEGEGGDKRASLDRLEATGDTPTERVRVLVRA